MQQTLFVRRLLVPTLAVAVLSAATTACAADAKQTADVAAAPAPTGDSGVAPSAPTTGSATGDVASRPAVVDDSAARADTAASPATPSGIAADGPGDTTELHLIAGRNKHDERSFAAVVRQGNRRLASWPTTPTPAPGALIPRSRIIAYYGNPHSKKMGVIGEYPEQQMLGMLDKTVAQWKAADPSTPITPAIHLVAVVAQGAPGPDKMWRRREGSAMIEKTYGWAKSRNGVLFLDIQASHSTLQKELPLLLPYLERPDVHLGVDPEFYMHYKREGVRPSAKVGQMMASDVNYAIRTLDQLVREKKIPPKVLVVHRFRTDMTPDYQNIRPTPNVQVVMHMDGWGPPWLKFDSYHHYVVNEPVQFTGFKLFYHNDTKKGDALLTPRELLQLRPTLSYIQYQ